MLKYTLVFFFYLAATQLCVSFTLKKANLRVSNALSQEPIEDCHKQKEEKKVVDSCKIFGEYKADQLYKEDAKIKFENFVFKSLVDNTDQSPNIEKLCKDLADCLERSIDWILVGECPGSQAVTGDSDESAQSLISTDALDI